MCKFGFSIISLRTATSFLDPNWVKGAAKHFSPLSMSPDKLCLRVILALHPCYSTECILPVIVIRSMPEIPSVNLKDKHKTPDSQCKFCSTTSSKVKMPRGGKGQGYGYPRYDIPADSKEVINHKSHRLIDRLP